MKAQATASTHAGIGGKSCAHCGDLLDAGPVVVRSLGGIAQEFCCQGCAFIAEQLLIARSTQRDVVALQGDSNPSPAQAAASVERVSFTVHGMVCAACALLIEARLRATDGVARASVDFATRRAAIAFDPARTGADRLRAALASLGYETDRSAAGIRRAAHVELARVLLAWLVMMQVMMLAFPAYVAAPGEIAADIEQLLRIAQLVLAAPVMFFCALPLARAAVNQCRARAPGMDVPIVLGLAAAFGASLWATVQASGDVYFDSITMFVALVLGIRWVQARALARAHRVIEVAEQSETLTARRLRLPVAGSDAAGAASIAHDRVVASDLVPGDQVWVHAGEAFPADGLIAAGASSVSQAWLIGESRPLGVVPGSGVLAGSVNLEAPVTLEVTRAGESTSLAALRRLVERAGESRPRMVETANRVARIFLQAVLVLAAGTLLAWSWIDPAQALPNALAVLIATCPCALSLAAPTVLTAAQSVLARGGVLVARAAAMETLARIDSFAFDKTGTLTTNEPTLARVILLRDLPRDRALEIAAALAGASGHPFARALADAVSVAGLDAPMPLASRVTAGEGVEATVWDRPYRLGRLDFALGLCGTLGRATQLQSLAGRAGRPASGLALLADEAGPIALFTFGESLRDGAAQAMHALGALGVTPLVLSGDRREAVRRVAVRAGVAAAQVHAEMRPNDKCQHIAALQAAGRCVAMCGDGINDAPVLARADVSFALGAELGGAALAQMNADFIVLGADLRQVAAAVATARRALRLMRQNFGWSLAYNLAVLPLAAIGWLSPALATIGMAASSLIVIGNALRVLHGDGDR